MQKNLESAYHQKLQRIFSKNKSSIHPNYYETPTLNYSFERRLCANSDYLRPSASSSSSPGLTQNGFYQKVRLLNLGQEYDRLKKLFNKANEEIKQKKLEILKDNVQVIERKMATLDAESKNQKSVVALRYEKHAQQSKDYKKKQNQLQRLHSFKKTSKEILEPSSPCVKATELPAITPKRQRLESTRSKQHDKNQANALQKSNSYSVQISSNRKPRYEKLRGRICEENSKSSQKERAHQDSVYQSRLKQILDVLEVSQKYNTKENIRTTKEIEKLQMNSRPESELREIGAITEEDNVLESEMYAKYRRVINHSKLIQ